MTNCARECGVCGWALPRSGGGHDVRHARRHRAVRLVERARDLRADGSNASKGRRVGNSIRRAVAGPPPRGVQWSNQRCAVIRALSKGGLPALFLAFQSRAPIGPVISACSCTLAALAAARVPARVASWRRARQCTRGARSLPRMLAGRAEFGSA